MFVFSGNHLRVNIERGIPDIWLH